MDTYSQQDTIYIEPHAEAMQISETWQISDPFTILSTNIKNTDLISDPFTRLNLLFRSPRDADRIGARNSKLIENPL